MTPSRAMSTDVRGAQTPRAGNIGQQARIRRPTRTDSPGISPPPPLRPRARAGRHATPRPPARRRGADRRGRTGRGSGVHLTDAGVDVSHQLAHLRLGACGGQGVVELIADGECRRQERHLLALQPLADPPHLVTGRVRSGRGWPWPGRLSKSPFSMPCRIWRSIQVSQVIPGGFRPVMTPSVAREQPHMHAWAMSPPVGPSAGR